MSRSTRRPSDASYVSVDWQNPVNWNHGTNRELAAWYLNVPHFQGGLGDAVFHDLTHKNDANLGTATVNPLWEGSNGRRGGWGSLHFDGVNDFVTLNTNFGHGTAAGSFTYMLWFNSTTAGDRCMIGRFANGDLFQIHTRAVNGGLRVAYGRSPFDVIANTVNYLDGAWHQAAFTYAAGAGELFADGKSIGTDAAVTADFADTQALHLGQRAGDSEIEWEGVMDDIRIWNRALSSDEIYECFINSQLGYPGLLNRWGHRAWSTQVAVAATGQLLQIPHHQRGGFNPTHGGFSA